MVRGNGLDFSKPFASERDEPRAPAGSSGAYSNDGKG